MRRRSTIATALDGHLFQGRFYSALVEGDWHLLELSRYLALNPVEARLCRHPGEWPWSSYSAVAGLEARAAEVPRLSTRCWACSDGTCRSAQARFRAFVNDQREPSTA